jgi:hypothetical protein
MRDAGWGVLGEVITRSELRLFRMPLPPHPVSLVHKLDGRAVTVGQS